MQLSGPLFNLGTFFRQIDETSVDVEELFHMLNTKPIVKESPDAKDFKYKDGAIKIKNLSYKHIGAKRPLLDDFSLDIEPGTTNAIVGSSGFGKTTLFNLLFRIYEPENGTILIDDQDIKDLKFESFRKNISMIP